MLKQKTLKDSFSLSGKGLHTGLDLTVTFNPAPDNHGYKIQRTDVEGQPIIDAVADNVTETTRGTVLSKNGVKVSTVEHGMAALYALGIDNCLIQVNGPEFPILDGSAQYYAKEIERVGTEEQNAVKDFYIIKSKIEFRDEKTGSSIIVLPDENFSLNVLVSYDSTIIPNQFATLEDMSKFRDEVAGSRTFVFVREIEPLLQAGLIKGGDLDNAIVIYEREMSQEDFDKLADVMGVPHMDAKQLGKRRRRQSAQPSRHPGPGARRGKQGFPQHPPPAAGNPPQRAHPETARRDHRLAAQQGGGFAQGRAYEVEASRPAFAQFGDEPLDASGQQETSCANGQQVIVGGHRRRGVEIARLRILRPVDEHQPPETPPARTPQRTDARDFEFARTDPLDADHAVARRQRGEFRGVTAGVEHHDHLVTRVFGGEEIFNLRRIRHAAAQDRDADAVGGVAGSPAHGVQQQSFAAGAGDQRQQRAHACRRRSEQQEKDRLHARLRL